MIMSKIKYLQGQDRLFASNKEKSLSEWISIYEAQKKQDQIEFENNPLWKELFEFGPVLFEGFPEDCYFPAKEMNGYGMGGSLRHPAKSNPDLYWRIYKNIRRDNLKAQKRSIMFDHIYNFFYFEVDIYQHINESVFFGNKEHIYEFKIVQGKIGGIEVLVNGKPSTIIIKD